MKVLYIPGLGEGFVLRAQMLYIKVLNLFRSHKDQIVVFESRWASQESFSKKLQRLQQFYEKSGLPEIVAAPSAGGALAVYLSSLQDTIKEVHTVCAKLEGSEKIGELYQKRAPALVDAVVASEKLLHDNPPKTLICYAPTSNYDGVVEREDMIHKSAQVINLPNLSHSRAILYWLGRYLPRLN